MVDTPFAQLGASEAFEVLKAQALAYPEAWEDHPWGEPAFKVGTKVFAFVHRPEGGLSLTVKIPGLKEFALEEPFASPAGYGLGRSGWITARFAATEDVPVELMAHWLRVSYGAVAPKKLIKALEAAETEGAGAVAQA